MKRIHVALITAAVMLMTGQGWSQQPVTAPPPPPADINPPATANLAAAPNNGANPNGMPVLSPEQLQQLVSPIALYPDPLISLILPASTVPTDIVLAARYLKGGGDPNKVDQQNWDQSVKGLVHYPRCPQLDEREP